MFEFGKVHTEMRREQKTRNDRNRERMRVFREDLQVKAQEQGTSVRNVERKSSKNYNLEREAFQYDSTKEYNQHENVVIGKMDSVCNFCGAKKFKNETPGMCCLNGKVEINTTGNAAI